MEVHRVRAARLVYPPKPADLQMKTSRSWLLITSWKKMDFERTRWTIFITFLAETDAVPFKQ